MQTRKAIIILLSIFLLIVTTFLFSYLFNHYTNNNIFEKAKKEINSQRNEYLQLYQYLADSTNENHPVSSIMYRRGWGYLIFTINDTLNHEHNFRREVPSFVNFLNFSAGAAFNRSTQSMFVDLPFTNYHFYRSKIIYSNILDTVIKNQTAKGFQLCNDINEISDNKNSIIKIDSNWLLQFYKK